MDDYKFYLDNTFEEYSGKWIAIKNEKVVGASADLEELSEELTTKGISLKDVLIASVPRRDIALVYTQC